MKEHLKIPVIILITFAIGGCIGSLYRIKSKDTSSTIKAGFKGEPDNCTKCHFAWAERFDYYRGWDRYGYIFSDRTVAGFYDPWNYPSIDNMFRAYYATDWWKTEQQDTWPNDIADKAESLSILSRGDGLPKIPRSREDINGPVIIVARQGGDYSTIAEAVKKAKPGTTVFVRPGEYNEVLTLKDGVNLIGENPYTTIINPLNKGHAIRAANNSIIAGFTLTGTGIVYKTKEFNCAVYVSGCDSTCIIANNIFRENGLFGVWIDGAIDKKKNRNLDKKYGNRKIEIHDRPYLDYPNPVIVGNTFYRVGQRGVFCVHARGEIFNNIFAGNVKAVGMERHSRPFFHHNVCYFNNVPMAVNRSEPLVCNNIMLRNQWGQRMLRGANPVIFNNVTWNSPHFRDFDEEGRPFPYNTHPGTGERILNPAFVDPLEGDFRFSDLSPLRGKTRGFDAVGIMRDPDIPQPPTVKCADSYGREVLSMTDDIVKIIERVDSENAKIRNLKASYRINYEGYLDIAPDSYGDPAGFKFTTTDYPAVRIEYMAPQWSMDGAKRVKQYTEIRTAGGKTTEESAKVIYNGSHLDIRDASPGVHSYPPPDQKFIGERPFRDKPGGFYRDYDQFVKGAAGTMGTFYNGYLRIMGGKIEDKKATVDGHECIVVRYPHIGKDQYFLFYLDIAIGFRPRKMEQYYNETLYRVMDSYRYKAFPGGIHLPVHVSVTDFSVIESHRGEKVAAWELVVDESSIKINY